MEPDPERWIRKNPEDEGSMFLRNVGIRQQDCAVLKPRTRPSEQSPSQHTGFVVLTPVVMKITAFLYVLPCNPLKGNPRFRGIYCLHLHSQFATCFYAGILFGLFYPEDGGDIFLRNVFSLLVDYTAFCLRG
jgi:hypothetical protein